MINGKKPRFIPVLVRFTHTETISFILLSDSEQKKHTFQLWNVNFRGRRVFYAREGWRGLTVTIGLVWKVLGVSVGRRRQAGKLAQLAPPPPPPIHPSTHAHPENFTDLGLFANSKKRAFPLQRNWYTAVCGGEKGWYLTETDMFPPALLYGRTGVCRCVNFVLQPLHVGEGW
jgi:hypothetical protein